MVDKRDIDGFVKRMEEMYHPSHEYAKKTHNILSTMLAPDFPADQAPRIFALAEEMYRSHARRLADLDAARKDVEGIVSNVGRMVDGIKTMTNAYASSVEEIVHAGEELSAAAQARCKC